MSETTNAQKTPISKSLSDFSTAQALDHIQQTGRALPVSVTAVSGAIITVKFEVQSGFTLPPVTVPLAGAEYIRYPIQVGDTGVVFPADAYLGGITDLGGGTANLKPRGNLSTLVFFPIARKRWTAVDPNAVTVYGPNGVVTRDTQSNMVVTLTPTGVVAQLKNGSTFTINGSGITATMANGTPFTIVGDLHVTGDIWTEFGTGGPIRLRTHIHAQGPDSRGDAEQNTTPPIAGT